MKTISESLIGLLQLMVDNDISCLGIVRQDTIEAIKMQGYTLSVVKTTRKADA